MSGREKTEKWIEAWNVRDGAGRRHRPHGIWTIAARLTVYVTFDRHPRIGQKAIYFFTSSLQAIADFRSNQEPTYGSREGNSHTRTGAGYLFAPFGPDDRTFVDRVERLDESGRDDSERAVEIVSAQLAARGLAPRPATLAEQKTGIDLVASDGRGRYGMEHVPVEVKSRTRKCAYDALFLQLSETNDDMRVR